MLSDEELARIRAQYDKPRRQQLESKWGFTGLIGELSRSGDPLFNGIGAMAHGYSVASHIAHMDCIGVGMPMERDLRPSERKETVHLTHEGRLISDLLVFLFLRLWVGYRFVGADATVLKGAWAKIEAVTAQFGETRSKWMNIEYPAAGAG